MNQSPKPQAKSPTQHSSLAYLTPEKRTKPRDYSPGKKSCIAISDENMAEIAGKIREFTLFWWMKFQLNDDDDLYSLLFLALIFFMNE